MPSAAVMAAATPWPAVLVGVAVVVGVCLWLLFRPGSMADRARTEDREAAAPEPETDPADGLEGDGGQAPSGGR